jgi:hypothetical protein
MVRRSIYVILALLSLLSLSGCLLTSGGETVSDLRPDGGNISVQFVSADGEELRTLPTSNASSEVSVTVFVSAETGELRIDILNPDGAVAFSTQSRPGQGITRTGRAQTNANGELQYRIVARNARKGNYEVFYQP